MESPSENGAAGSPRAGLSDDKKAKQYNRIKLAVSLAEIVLSFALLLLLVVTGMSKRFEVVAHNASAQPYLAFLVFVFLVGIVEMVVTSPIGFYKDFILEHRFGLSNQSFFRWLWEESKGLAIGIVLFAPILLVFFFFLRHLQELWWLPVAGVMFVFGVLLARLGPVLIFPLFYKFEPIADEGLKERLLKMAKPLGVRISGVFRFNLSKNTKKANAAFAGLGRTKRIIIGDTLLDNFSYEEIENVFAHELGHYRLGHMWKGIIAGFITTFVGLFLTSVVYGRSVRWLGFSGIDQLAALPLLALFFSLYALLTMPMQNSVSRYFERQADRFALDMQKTPGPFISAMERLASMNLSDPNPHPLVEFWLYSHPAVGKRIQVARGYVTGRHEGQPLNVEE